MRVVIVEDEELVAQELEGMLGRLKPDFQVVARLDSVSNAVDWFTNNQADLVFMDIQLGDGNSFSIFDKVEINTPVIFTTAYDEYAIHAFKFNSIDFLLKPVDEEDLLNALNKVDRMREALVLSKEETPLPVRSSKAVFRKRFLISSGIKMKSVPSQEVAYFRADGKYLYLADIHGNRHLVDSSLKDLEPQLDPDRFFRINRKMIINYEAIREVIAFSKNRKKVLVEPAPEDPLETIVSIERTKTFLAWLNQ